MLILHGGYLPSSALPEPPAFYLWGEGHHRADAPRERYPRAAEWEVLEPALRSERVFLGGHAASRRRTLVMALPARHGRVVPSTPALRDPSDYAAAGAATLRLVEVPALQLALDRTLDLLLHLPELLQARHALAGDDLEYWAEAARWVYDLLLRRRVAPAVSEGALVFRPVLSDPHEKERLARFAEAMPSVSRTALGWAGSAPARVPQHFPAASGLMRSFLEDAIDSAARDCIREVLPAERRRPQGTGPEASAVASLATPAGEPHPTLPELASRLHEWSMAVLEAPPTGAARLGVRLHAPRLTADAPPPPEDETGWSLSFHLEATDDPSVQLYADEIWAGEGPRRRRFSQPEETLLARLGGVASLCRPIARSLEDRRPTGAALTLEEAHHFLTAEAPLLRDAGVSVYLPSEGKLARIEVRLHAQETAWKSGAVTRFGLDTLVDFDWRVAVGDRELTPAEFEELASTKVPLVTVGGEWVLLDTEGVARTLRLFDRRPAGRTTLGEMLRLAGGLDAGIGAVPLEEVTADGWLQQLLDPRAAREEILAAEPPKSLHGALRPYQQRGVGWLRFLLSRGLGACLADDMGLGKTVQLLATLLAAREAGEAIAPTLVICPTSVADNWLKEAERFAPSLTAAVHHGPGRASGQAFEELVKQNDILVTTYALAHRDRAPLSSVVWEYLVLDEAQNVKNPAAAQSRAVAALTARRRVALTGTPVENRLAELKSIFDILSPGFLGSDEGFRRDFVVPIERHRDPDALRRLTRVTAPFLLRRAKTDEGVAQDLPEKFETKEHVGLTREQAALYRAATKTLLSGIGRAHGASRRAKVLLLLLRLKQICNHPALYLGEDRLEGRSSKMDRLLELLEETLAEKSPSLIFTQFAEMGHLLVKGLQERFGSEVLYLHGGVPRKARTEMVRRFQEDDDPPPFFVLSLRAGGSGLNLTRASHVFHFDRWWNPAVEDQATDRAFRIGQTRNVQVHKFVCRGTLEERIDRMIEEKKELSNLVVGVGETWITEMSTDELAELVALSRDALEDTP